MVPTSMATHAFGQRAAPWPPVCAELFRLTGPSQAWAVPWRLLDASLPAILSGSVSQVSDHADGSTWGISQPRGTHTHTHDNQTNTRTRTHTCTHTKHMHTHTHKQQRRAHTQPSTIIPASCRNPASRHSRCSAQTRASGLAGAERAKTHSRSTRNTPQTSQHRVGRQRGEAAMKGGAPCFLRESF